MFHALTQQHMSSMHLHSGGATTHSATMSHLGMNHVASHHHAWAPLPPHPHPAPPHPHPAPSQPHPQPLPPRTPIPGDPYYPHPHLPPTSHGITLGGYIPPSHPQSIPSGAYPVAQGVPHVPTAITGGTMIQNVPRCWPIPPMPPA